jgi:hypothetical protein
MEGETDDARALVEEGDVEEEDDVRSLQDDEAAAPAALVDSRKRKRNLPLPRVIPIAMDVLPPYVPSIYISFVHPATRWNSVAKTVAHTWGYPSHGQVIPRKFASKRGNETVFKGNIGPSRAVVHMSSWFMNPYVQDVRADLLQGKYVRLDMGNGHFLGCTVYKYKDTR